MDFKLPSANELATPNAGLSGKESGWGY